MTPIREIPPNVIRSIPPPVIRTIDPITPPVTQVAPPPVTRGIKPPVINVPDYEIDYPTIDVPTEEEWRGIAGGDQQQITPDSPTRDLPETPAIPVQPTINIGGNEIPVPEAAPLIAAGASAIVATGVTLGATMAFQQLKSAIEPLTKKRKGKIKVKKVKTVLHFVPNSDETIDVIEYSARGMRVVDSGIDKLEQYLRDAVDLNTFYEYDYKLIIDEDLKKNFTKAGEKRFSRHFASPAKIAKKLSARFSI